MTDEVIFKLIDSFNEEDVILGIHFAVKWWDLDQQRVYLDRKQTNTRTSHKLWWWVDDTVFRWTEDIIWISTCDRYTMNLSTPDTELKF